MARPERWRGGLALLLATVVGTSVLAGCRTGGEDPVPTPTDGATPRPFTVMSTDPIRVTDPAAITDTASSVVALNVFQRLMTADPGASVLKPDAARDCQFTSLTTYTCTLNQDLKFHNGHPLTASDVKFSIERAARLKVTGSSVSLLASLRKIETPDDVTIRFLLFNPDTQFGWALASPAASIVDEEVYNADQVSAPKDPMMGSGPFAVAKYDSDELQLTRYADYLGRNPARRADLLYRTVADSATVEDAMTKGQVDVVWRGLDAAAITRVQAQLQGSTEGRTSSGFSQVVLPGCRVLQLHWSPRSPARANKGLRAAIAVALQGDRTSDSVVPNGIPGHVASLPIGGKAKPKVTWKNRISLTLGYDPTAPNGQDVATQLRTRLENTGGLSVRLRPGDVDADLQLVDRKAWTATALAWLAPYLEAPLPAAAETVTAVTNEYRRTNVTDDEAANDILGALQKQAAVDLVILPISQSDEYLYTRDGVEIAATSYGPGWQLGLFGIGDA